MIKAGSEVTMHFSIKLADGSAADSTKVSGKPATVTIGSGVLSPMLEQALVGLNPGDKKQVILPPEEAAGMPHAQNIRLLSLAQFPKDLNLEPGLIVAFTQPDGQELPGIIRQIDQDLVTVDFNHPLAGQTLTVDVEILEVK